VAADSAHAAAATRACGVACRLFPGDQITVAVVFPGYMSDHWSGTSSATLFGRKVIVTATTFGGSPRPADGMSGEDTRG